MNLEIGIVLGILGITVILLVRDKYSPDIVAMLALLALLLNRTLDTTEALAGFGNPAVITIAAIFLVTTGLTNTGVAAWIGEYILRVAGKGEARLVAVTMAASALLSLVMNNIASASVLLPGLIAISRQTRISPSKLLIPLSFGTLLGGMATLFTTVNLLVNEALRQKGFAPFSLWDFFRLGSVLTIAGIAFMATLGRKFLPDYRAKDISVVRRLPEDLARLYRLPERLLMARVLAGSPLDGRSISESQLGQDYDLNILGILRRGRYKLAPDRDEVLRAGDRLMLEGEVDPIRQSHEGFGLIFEPAGAALNLELADSDIGIVEVVVSPHADVVGRTLREIHFREKFGLSVLALLHEGEPVGHGVQDARLRFGDALLVQGPRQRLKMLRAERDFILVDEPEYTGEIAQARQGALGAVWNGPHAPAGRSGHTAHRRGCIARSFSDDFVGRPQDGGGL